MKRGFTLIELLIVVAIIAILSALLAFSGALVTQRALLAGHLMAVESDLSIAFDSIAGDVARSTGHAWEPETLILETPNHVVIYTRDSDTLIREISDEAGSHRSVLMSECSGVTFGEIPGGISVVLESEITLREQTRTRRWESAIAWPEWVME